MTLAIFNSSPTFCIYPPLSVIISPSIFHLPPECLHSDIPFSIALTPHPTATLVNFCFLVSAVISGNLLLSEDLEQGASNERENVTFIFLSWLNVVFSSSIHQVPNFMILLFLKDE